MGLKAKSGGGVLFGVNMEKLIGLMAGGGLKNLWAVEHWRPVSKRSGAYTCLDREPFRNILTTEGMTYLMGLGFDADGQAKITNWRLLLFSDDYTPQLSDTYTTPGFTESTDYSGTDRPAWTEDGCSGTDTVSISNADSKASFTMQGNDTAIYGAGFVGGDDATTKGDTTAGNVLYAAGKFATPKTGIESGDILKLTCTATLTNAA